MPAAFLPPWREQPTAALSCARAIVPAKMSSVDPALSAFLLRRISELGPMRSTAIAFQAGDLERFEVDRFNLEDAERWAKESAADGLLEPSDEDVEAWQITDAGLQIVAEPPG